MARETGRLEEPEWQREIGAQHVAASSCQGQSCSARSAAAVGSGIEGRQSDVPFVGDGKPVPLPYITPGCKTKTCRMVEAAAEVLSGAGMTVTETYLRQIAWKAMQRRNEGK